VGPAHGATRNYSGAVTNARLMPAANVVVCAAGIIGVVAPPALIGLSRAKTQVLLAPPVPLTLLTPFYWKLNRRECACFENRQAKLLTRTGSRSLRASRSAASA